MGAVERARPKEMRPELQMAFQLGMAILILLMGTVLLLAMLGIIESDEPVGMLQIGVGIPFALVTFWVATRIGLSPLLAIADTEGAKDPVSALALGVDRLLGRLDGRSVLAAAFFLPLTVGYWRSLHGQSLLGWSEQGLIEVVSIEFLLIHGFPFLVIAASFARLPDRGPRTVGAVGMALLFALYSAFAWGAGRWAGIADLLYLMIPSALAFARPSEGARVRITAGMRWVTKLFVFFLVALVLNERDLVGAGNLRIGLIYFGIVTVLEAFRVPEIPLDLGPAWARVPIQKRRELALKPAADSD